MLEEVIMRLVKSNESESGCKTKLTNKLTNKTNVEQKCNYTVYILFSWKRIFEAW